MNSPAMRLVRSFRRLLGHQPAPRKRPAPTPRLEELERRDLPAITTPLHYDFGTSTSPVAPGYTGVAVVGYSSTRGYGWQKTSAVSTKTTSTADPLTCDFQYGKDATFLVNLPNGTYTVTGTLGDPTAAHTGTAIWLEGQQVASGLGTQAGQVLQQSYVVQVTGGQLTLRIASTASKTQTFAIAGLDIAPVAPVANAAPALTAPEGSPVTFSGSVTSGVGPFTYTWDFGDGTTASGTLTPTRTYRDNGTYIATLTVTDSTGSTSGSMTTVNVSNVPPTVTIAGAPASGHSPEGTSLGLTATATDPGAADITAGLSWTWSVTWNGLAYASGTGRAVNFTPPDNGTCVVTITATDKDGGQGSAQATITVDNVAPTATPGGPYAGTAGSPIAFSASAVDPCPADSTAGLTYLWDFGDGTTSTQQAPTHTYAVAGNYAVTLTASDKDGGISTATTTASVNPVTTFRTISGVYSLCIPNAPIAQAVLTDPYVDGVAIRSTWDAIETADGVYNWTYLDNQIAAAVAAGKTVTHSIPAGINTPTWVYAQGAQSFTFINAQSPASRTIPVPWDPVYLAEFEQFIQALGARYGSNPAVVGVAITGINSTTEETILPCSKGQTVTSGGQSWTTTNDLANWQAIGYTRLKVENAWQAIADTFAAAFTAVKLSLVVVPNNFPPIDNNGNVYSASGDNQIVTDLINIGIARYGNHLAVQSDGLSDFWIYGQVTGVASKVTTGHQMLWNVCNDPSGRMNNYVTPFDPHTVLQQAVSKGIAGGARYLQIYQIDVLNSGMQDILAGAQAQLKNLPPSATITGMPASGHSPEGTIITLGSSVIDPNSIDTTTGFLYSWTVTKDGVAYASGSGASFSFTPLDNGTYAVTLVVTDTDGVNSQPATVSVIVDGAPPAVQLGAFTGSASGAVAFWALITDPGLLDAATGYRYLWSFGDGAGSIGAAPSHVYAQAGTYPVTLTVIDKDGLTTTVTTTATIF